jgi:large subunit ribosomal protein L29
MDLATAQDELKTQRRQLFDLRIQKERGEVKDTRQFAKTKADIARLLYHIGELHHAEVVEAEGGLDQEDQEGQEAASAATTRPSRPSRRRAAGTAEAAESPVRVVEPEARDTTAQMAEAAVPLPAAEPQTTPRATPELPATTTGSEDENA